MLYIIEGANFCGKTTTINILEKKKSFITFYHPRFNDAQHFCFDYNCASRIGSDNQILSQSIHVPRDVIYQISHMTCLKYLTSVKDKKVLLDRCFLSEMCYNELYDKKIYHEFINALETNFPYKIFLLTVNDNEALKKRIIGRLKKDAAKGYGIRDSKGFVPEPATVEDKMKSQRAIELKYIQFISQFSLNHSIIDTSDKTKREVANIIATWKE